MLKKMNEQEKRQANGGSVAALMNMRWISIVPYPVPIVPWRLGQRLGQMIANRRK